MNLDDYSSFSQIDSKDMISQINNLPDQLEFAWDLGRKLPLPDWKGIDRVLVAGMGGSAISADLITAYLSSKCPLPIFVHRNYDLPQWAKGPNTLVIASSHSGNTEETLSAFEAAVSNSCRILVMTTGGQLAKRVTDTQAVLWRFEHEGQPRAAVGYSFALVLAALNRMGLVSDPTEDLYGATKAMRSQQEGLLPEVEAVNNLAKRTAGQMMGRWIVVVGADILEPVARRWKGQISEISKAWGQFEFLPESDHNTLAGLLNPEEVLMHTMVLFLRASSYHPRNLLRSNLTRKAFMVEGLNTDFIDGKGETPLSQMWTALHLGDYTTYYLAMAYEVDPSPVATIEEFKREMSGMH